MSNFKKLINLKGSEFNGKPYPKSKVKRSEPGIKSDDPYALSYHRISWKKKQNAK